MRSRISESCCIDCDGGFDGGDDDRSKAGSRDGNIDATTFGNIAETVEITAQSAGTRSGTADARWIQAHSHLGLGVATSVGEGGGGCPFSAWKGESSRRFDGGVAGAEGSDLVLFLPVSA
jgi:hypothetical protein